MSNDADRLRADVARLQARSDELTDRSIDLAKDSASLQERIRGQSHRFVRSAAPQDPDDSPRAD